MAGCIEQPAENLVASLCAAHASIGQAIHYRLQIGWQGIFETLMGTCDRMIEIERIRMQELPIEAQLGGIRT